MNSKNQNADRSRLWKKVGEDFRRACLLRREGKQAEASDILDRQLPESIAAWAQVSGMREPERRERLNELFEREQNRVEDAWLTQQIILRQVRDILIPSLCLQVAEEVREVMELQVAEMSRQMARTESIRGTTPVPAPSVRALPRPEPVVLSAVRPQPSFDDLPAIIDDLINAELSAELPAAARMALV